MFQIYKFHTTKEDNPTKEPLNEPLDKPSDKTLDKNNI